MHDPEARELFAFAVEQLDAVPERSDQRRDVRAVEERDRKLRCGRVLQLGALDQDPRLGEPRIESRVVVVEVCVQHIADVARLEAVAVELRVELLLRRPARGDTGGGGELGRNSVLPSFGLSPTLRDG